MEWFLCFQLSKLWINQDYLMSYTVKSTLSYLVMSQTVYTLDQRQKHPVTILGRTILNSTQLKKRMYMEVPAQNTVNKQMFASVLFSLFLRCTKLFLEIMVLHLCPLIIFWRKSFGIWVMLIAMIWVVTDEV